MYKKLNSTGKVDSENNHGGSSWTVCITSAWMFTRKRSAKNCIPAGRTKKGLLWSLGLKHLFVGRQGGWRWAEAVDQVPDRAIASLHPVVNIAQRLAVHGGVKVG